MIPRNLVGVEAMAATPGGKHRATADLFGSHALIAFLIIAGHGLLWVFTDNMFHQAYRAPMEMDGPVPVAWVRVQTPEWDASPLPEVQLTRLPVNLNTLEAVQFEVDNEDELGEVIGPSSAPRLSRYQSVSLREYSRRAGVTVDHPLIVVVTLEVLRDGSVGSVTVTRSCGDPDKDAVAVEYARHLQWIAGTVNQQPRVMRMQFPITLASPPMPTVAH